MIDWVKPLLRLFLPFSSFICRLGWLIIGEESREPKPQPLAASAGVPPDRSFSECSSCMMHFASRRVGASVSWWRCWWFGESRSPLRLRTCAHLTHQAQEMRSLGVVSVNSRAGLDREFTGCSLRVRRPSGGLEIMLALRSSPTHSNDGRSLWDWCNFMLIGHSSFFLVEVTWLEERQLATLALTLASDQLDVKELYVW